MALWFDKTIDPITVSADQELSLTLGARTLVQLTGSSTVQIFGLAQAGGNIDGAVVTFMNVSNSGTCAFRFMALSASASSTANRFRNPSQSTGNFTTVGFRYGGITYRYDAAQLLWVQQQRA
jgi:hypothetical protein